MIDIYLVHNRLYLSMVDMHLVQNMFKVITGYIPRKGKAIMQNLPTTSVKYHYQV